MKKKLTKLMAAILSAMLVITAFCIPAGAFDITESQLIKEGEKISVSGVGEGRYIFRKIKVDTYGRLNFYCGKSYSEDNWGWNVKWYPRVCVIDEYGNRVDNYGDDKINFRYDLGDATSVYVKKGTYYLQFSMRNGKDYFNDFYYTFTPEKEKDPPVRLAVTLKKGKTLNLGSVVSNYSGKIKWTTSDKSVASVSKGKVKALKTGKSRIRAVVDNGEYAEIIVNVK